ncbi:MULTISPECIES: hypothetical protein [Halorussus]|uniref:hypothetical protein n=1 Tax=Halorussus TaxID=1070314 RepID=UPI00209EFD61|nr:hypothetical protein [Halorussus vallis]USZ77212.1 hypothetical protein NGM07_07740 [Halorussus vallis]
MVEVIIYVNRESELEEVARVTIEGDVLGESPTSTGLRERFVNDPRLDCFTDGRDLLRYISASYTTGYHIAVYDSEESKRIVEELSDETYESWRESTELETQL